MLIDNLELDKHTLLPETQSDRTRRRALGIYYTPPEAAKVLARWAIRNPEEIVLEPSFGGCAMLSAAVSAFEALGNKYPSKQLYGYDVDPTAFAHLAKIGIENVEAHFKLQDFLCSSAEGLRVDAVLANPPFVSYHRLSDDQRKLTEHLRQCYLPHLPRKASLWAYFLLHALSFLRVGGRMAFVLPNAIGTADYAKPLMKFLMQKFCKAEIIHVSERLFIQAGADERISLLFLSDYRPEGVAEPGALIVRDVVRIKEILANNDSSVELADYPDITAVRLKASAALNELSENVLCALGTKASVRIGEVVGDIRFFVRPISEWKKLGIDQSYLEPIITRSVQIRGIYVPRKTIQEEVSPIPYLLLPPEKQVPAEINSYLEQYTEQAIAINKTFGKRPIWYRCSYTSNADAFIGSMSHDYARIIGNDAGISCSNAFYKINVLDHPDLSSWLPILSLTTPFRLSAEVLGRIRGSGGIKLEPSDVNKLCIPQILPKLDSAEFEALKSRLNNMLILGELDAASQLADSQVFLQPGFLDAKAMNQLRLMRLSLTNYRLITPQRES